MNLCADTHQDINVCDCPVCGPLRRIKEASAARRKALFQHRNGQHKTHGQNPCPMDDTQDKGGE
mgnify:CR=1 FL=1